LAKNSSSVINVESFFSFTSFLANRVSRFISGSLSAINHACTECGTCASVCPSEAISLPWSHRTYRA
jgi:ferredoxin